MERTKIHKILCVLLCCIFSISILTACNVEVAPQPKPSEKHECHSVCLECGECLDKDCNDPECYPKCNGHEHEEHICSQPCPECGWCLDKSCNDPECYPKCKNDHYTTNGAMPVIRINTTDGSNAFATVPNRDSKLRGEIEYVSATVTVEDDDDTLLDGVEASVKARGNYTLNYEKKPIRIKFNKKQSVLGLNGGAKFKNWVLLADWKDLSMTNNIAAFYLGKEILGADGYYCSDYRNVELYLNGSYWGVYLLAEQQEAKGDDGRTSAPAVDDDYAGTDVGYLVEYDGYYTDEQNMPNGAGDPTFELNYNNFATLTKLNGSPFYTNRAQKGYTVKSDIYSDDQLSFINSYMDNAYKIAYEAVYENNYYKFNSDYTNITPTSGTAQAVVSDVIDVQSLADMYVLSEIACDPDLAWSSFFISLDMTESGSKKLIFEAPWDFDSAFGIKRGCVNSGYGMYAANCDNPWLILLIHEDWFQDIVSAKWNELVAGGITTGVLELITTYKTVYESNYANNFTRWKNRIYNGNDELVWELNTYWRQAQAADYLYNWLTKRFYYLDAQWGDGEEDSKIPSAPEEGSTRYRFEAEDCYADDPIIIDNWFGELASGGYFLGKIDGSYGLSIILTVYVETDCTAFLSVGLSKRSFEAIFSDWFSVSVNGDLLEIPPRLIPACTYNETEWVAWTDVNLMPIELTSGYNTITFKTVGGNSTNVDYFDLWSTTPIRMA
ncbi:MAG: CotH kinase family protein [Clostridiales bacterium]|nr:CotH kinase family protein [Clostridiales bacterium]